MSLFDKAAKFAKSPKGRELTDKAKRAMDDPKKRAKLEELRTKVGKKGKH